MVWNEELGKEIPVGWESKCLEDVVKQICVGFVGQCYDYYCEKNEGIPMLRTTDLTEKGMSYKNLKYISREFHDKNKKSQLKKGYILVARHGANGMPVIFDRDFEANCLNVIIIKPNGLVMGSKLLHVYLNSEASIEQIQTSLGGSVQDVLNTKRVANLQLAFPSKTRIVSNISVLLNKLQLTIELKRKAVENLEILLELTLSKIVKN